MSHPRSCVKVLAKVIVPSALVGHFKIYGRMASCWCWWLLVRLGWWRGSWEKGFFLWVPLPSVLPQDWGWSLPSAASFWATKCLPLHYVHSWSPQRPTEVPLAVWHVCGAPDNGALLRLNHNRLDHDGEQPHPLLLIWMQEGLSTALLPLKVILPLF